MKKIEVTTDDGTYVCSEEQARAMARLQRAINSIAKGHTVGFGLVEIDGAGRDRSTLCSWTGEHLDKLADASAAQQIEIRHLGSLWEGNAPAESRSLREQ